MEVQTQTIPDVVVTTPSVETSQMSADTSSFNEGGVLNSLTDGKMNIKDIVISALLVVASVYAIFYYRKAFKDLEERISNEELQNMSDDVEELKYNLKKAMGNKYETT